jgi:hypothetical protein
MTMTAASAVDLDTTITEQQVISKIAWRLMPLIIICYFFAFFDSAAPSACWSPGGCRMRRASARNTWRR